MNTLGKLKKTTLNGSSVCNRGKKGDLAISPSTVSNLARLVDLLSNELSF